MLARDKQVDAKRARVVRKTFAAEMAAVDAKLEKRRARVRRAVAKLRAREDAGLGRAVIIYDAEMYSLLVRAGLVRDGTSDKELINAAFSKLLWDLAHRS